MLRDLLRILLGRDPFRKGVVPGGCGLGYQRTDVFRFLLLFLSFQRSSSLSITHISVLLLLSFLRALVYPHFAFLYDCPLDP